MDKLVKSVENVRPGKYDLQVFEMNTIRDRFKNDLFGLISFVFELGFARGQKAGAAK